MNAMPRNNLRARLAWLSCVALVGFTGLLWVGGDVWWPVFPLLYGPRFLAGVLVLPTLPFLLTQPRRGALPFLVALVVFLVGILDFRVGRARIIPGPPAALRLASYNVGGRVAVVARLLARIDSLGVDVAVVLECPELHAADGGMPPGWTSARYGGICLYSRYPIQDRNPPSDAGRRPIARAGILVAGQVVHIGMVHLASPHGVLMMFNDKSEIPGLGPLVRENLRERDDDSRYAAQFFSEDGDAPIIVAGDFNLPIESHVYRRYWSGYSDSFERAGLGVGATYRHLWYSIRIDHILTRGSIVAVRCWVGPDLGADHLPVFADLALLKR